MLALISNDVKQKLTLNRSPPPLYTGDFGNCLTSQSSVDVSRFDLAYDAGNRTLAFHLEGTSRVESEFVTGE